MGRIVVVDNPMDASHPKLFPWTGPYIDFLLREFPAGFPGSHRTQFNNQLLDVENYDRVISDDDDVLLVYCAGDPISGTIVTAIVTALVSVAVSYVVNAIFGPGTKPSDPKALSTPSPSPVYSVSSPTNQARLGQPVPVIYGRVLATPDIASQPYTWYADNEQYLGMLLCLGAGDYNVLSMQIADTPINQIDSGTVETWVFGPNDHNQTIGNISGETGIWENVDTSPEVGDQEITPPAKSGVQPATYDLVADSLLVDDPVISDVQVGSTVVLLESGGLNGNYTIASFSPDRRTVFLVEDLPEGTYETQLLGVTAAEDPVATVTFTYPGSVDQFSNTDGDDITIEMTGGSTGEVTNVTGTVGSTTSGGIIVTSAVVTGDALTDAARDYSHATVTLPMPTEGDVIFKATAAEVGPFVACNPQATTSRVMVDFVFPNGLYVLDTESGGLWPATVDLQFIMEPINATGDVTGGAITESESFTRNTNTPQRVTRVFTVPTARYRVSARRTNDKSNSAQDQSTVIWTGLKAVITPLGDNVYGPVTMVMAKIKATNGLASNATNRVGVTCQRVLDGTETVDPAQAYKDVVLDMHYGGGRPESELDYDGLRELSDASQGTNGFNAVFDSKTTVWDALERICQVAHAVPLPLGALFSVAVDQAQSLVRFAFDESRIVQDSMQVQYVFDSADDIDGYEVEFRDPTTFASMYQQYPANAVNVERVSLFGCTDASTAAIYAQRLWNRKLYRRKWVSWETELDGHLPQVGDLVTINHRLLPATEQYITSTVSPAAGSSVRLEAYKYDARVY